MKISGLWGTGRLRLWRERNIITPSIQTLCHSNEVKSRRRYSDAKTITLLGLIVP
jgi:hypothetical protein